MVVEENSDTSLLCTSTDGDVPVALLSWFRDEGVSQIPLITAGTDPLNATYIGDRNHQGQELVCKADQTGQAPEAIVKESRVTLNITC